ncbi:MAG: NAD(P)/FAD-dependent oxidoreductase [Bacteroidetes bacterium]|nr:NAD(P)/FAD-dependent oxidoreductase [Bacteroidota bacterium]
MANKEDFDIAIIGSGVSGLVCGCYLQKAGLKVAIFEAREEAGGGRMVHEAMRPGHLVQSCVWVDIDPVMPHQLNLELDRYGYQDTHMPSASNWAWGYVFEDETCLMNNCWDPRQTAEKVKRFSEHDANKILEIAGIMAQPYDDENTRFSKFAELLYTAPWTWENFDKLIDVLTPIIPFDDPYEVTDLNGFEMLDLMFESDQLKVFCASLAVGSGIYPHHTGGGASLLAPLLPLSFFYSHPKHGCHSMAHVYIRCFRALGGKLFNSCPVKKIIVAGGEAKGVILDDDAAFPGKEITAKKVVTNLNPRLTFTELVGEEHVERKLISQLKTNWKGEVSLVGICYALKERPHFAAEKYDPDIVHTLVGGMGSGSFEEYISGWGQRMGGRIAKTPWTYCFPHKDDPTQSFPGNAVANVSVEVPYAIYGKGGSAVWDDRDFRNMITKSIENFWDACPGGKNNILDSWMTTPLDLERINPNYIRGDFSAGAGIAHQMFYGNRDNFAGFENGGIITPIKNLYASGSGVGIAWSSGGNGYRAANHIAEELGIRNQPWWTHRIGEYITKKYIEKSYVPLKPTSVLDK